MEEYKRKTIETYDKNIEYFSKRFKSLMNLKKRPEFQKFINLLKGGKILDLGSSSGDHALYFKQQGLDVICVDLSKKMIELCKEKGLKAFTMDIENLDFEENSFDGIWAVSSLLHVPKLKIPKVIEKLHKILKKEGILFISVKEGKEEKIISDRFYSFWKKEELLELFREKFELIDFETVSHEDTIHLQGFFRKK